MIAIFSAGIVACQEEDLPQPIGSGISTVPNSVDAEFDEFRANIKEDAANGEISNQLGDGSQAPVSTQANAGSSNSGSKGSARGSLKEIRR